MLLKISRSLLKFGFQLPNEMELELIGKHSNKLLVLLVLLVNLLFPQLSLQKKQICFINRSTPLLSILTQHILIGSTM